MDKEKLEKNVLQAKMKELMKSASLQNLRILVKFTQELLK